MSAHQEKQMERGILKHRKGPLEYNATSIKAHLQLKMHARSVSRAYNRQGFNWKVPASKENYSDEHRAQRVSYAEAHKEWTAEEWSKVLFIDEHHLTHPVGKTGVRQMHARKRGVLRRKDERYHKDCVRPKSKNVKGGKSIMLLCAIVKDRCCLCEPVKRYIDKRKPRPAKPAKLSKAGTRLGRPPDPEAQAKKDQGKQFDELAFVEAIPELAKAARKALQVSADTPVTTLMDGWGGHWAPLAREAFTKHNLLVIEGYPATSADANPIENMFGNAQKPMDKIQAESKAKDESVTLARFRKHLASKAARREIQSSIQGMPARMKAIIDAEGGPTRY
jgi:hypothetical protein